MEMKLCIDCKHILTKGTLEASYSQCSRTSIQNPVDGKMSFFYCETMRLQGQPCGTNAALFEEKE